MEKKNLFKETKPVTIVVSVCILIVLVFGIIKFDKFYALSNARHLTVISKVDHGGGNVQQKGKRFVVVTIVPNFLPTKITRTFYLNEKDFGTINEGIAYPTKQLEYISE